LPGKENNFLHHNRLLFDEFTRREKDILRMMAMGLKSGSIAEKPYFSETTVSKLCRNIKRKLKVENTYDITRFAQPFDLI